MVQTVKNLPAMQETGVRSLGQEDPLEKGMATHFGILAWKIRWASGGSLLLLHGGGALFEAPSPPLPALSAWAVGAARGLPTLARAA